MINLDRKTKLRKEFEKYIYLLCEREDNANFNLLETFFSSYFSDDERIELIKGLFFKGKD